MDVRLVISKNEITPSLRKKEKRVKDVRPFFRVARAIMVKKTRQTFVANKSGGTYRGVKWAGFAPQYTRADGTEIPAHGGVKKIRGRGNVKGRLRHSGKRVNNRSNMMRDSGILSRGGSLGALITRDKLILRSSLKYGDVQQRLRPWLFFQTPQDPRELRGRLIEYVGG